MDEPNNSSVTSDTQNFAAQDSAPTATAQNPTTEGNKTRLADVVPAGASPETKDRITQTLARNVGKLMGVDPSKHKIYGEFDSEDDSIRAKNRSGKFPDGTVESEIAFTQGLANLLSFTQAKFAVAHEVAHGEQKFAKNPPEGKAAELDADTRAAKVMGAQLGIETIERMGSALPENHLPNATHPTVRERQANLVREFPDESLEIVKPVKSAIPDTLEPSPEIAGSLIKLNDQLQQCRAAFSKCGVAPPTHDASNAFTLQKSGVMTETKREQKITVGSSHTK
jgi:hypothetical protein